MARAPKKATPIDDEEEIIETPIDEDPGVIIEGEELIDEKKPAEKVGKKDTSDKNKRTPEEEAAELRKELASEREARKASDARAAENEKLAQTATSKAADSAQSQIVAQRTAIDNKVSEAQTKLDSIKQQLKQAKQAGDSDAEVDLQDALTDARYQLNAAEWDKKKFAAWEENQAKTPAQPAAAAASSSPYTTKEQAWIAKHPEFNSNKKFSRLAKIAAQEARDADIAQDSRGYFEYIENVLREQGLLIEDDEPFSGAGETETTTSVAAAPQRTGNASDVKPAAVNAKYPFLKKGFTIPADWVQAAKDQGFEGKEGIMEYANIRLEEESKASGSR